MELDTKSKKFKYSLLSKALCFIVSCIMIAGFILSVFNLYFSYCFSPTFFESASVKACINSTMEDLENILNSPDPNELKTELLKHRGNYIEAVANDYLNKKANVIKNELEYVANNYESETYNKNAISDEYLESIPDTAPTEQKYPLNFQAGNTIVGIQKILNYAQGQEFLKYEFLVREDAFYQSIDYFEHIITVYNQSFDFSYFYYDDNLSYDKEKIETDAANFFDKESEKHIFDYQLQKSESKNKIDKLVNIKYYIKTSTNTYTNMTQSQVQSKDIDSFPIYYFKDGDEIESKNFNSSNYEKINNAECFKIYVTNEIAQDTDEISQLYYFYNSLNVNMTRDICLSVITLLLAVMAMSVLIRLSGHKNDSNEIKTAFIDKLPGDIHTIISASLIAALIYCFAMCIEITVDMLTNIYPQYSLILLAVSLSGVAIWATLSEWLLSVIRIKKSGKAWFMTFIILKAALAIYKPLKSLAVAFENTFITYKPKHMRRRLFILAALYILFNVATVVLCIGYSYLIVLSPLFILVNIIVLYFVGKYIKDLDSIISSAKNHKPASCNTDKLYPSLKELNNYLKIANSEMNEAIENAVKNERTKTELITNVSHDLKTPLTSVISYVDLLKKCSIEDEEALKYISILEDKSANLKILIENLVEASKVSSGNVKLNKTSINLKELVTQAIVESTPEFEAKELDIIFDENCQAITVFADGQYTYRIIENLLSNAKKYSAPRTRVYASIRREDSFGIFEIKNISKSPLNISPQELTERFVRGDSSRGEEEGNGLGLSIAKELCTLQNGQLEISIDGDLFKATVKLPIN